MLRMRESPLPGDVAIKATWRIGSKLGICDDGQPLEQLRVLLPLGLLQRQSSHTCSMCAT